MFVVRYTNGSLHGWDTWITQGPLSNLFQQVKIFRTSSVDGVCSVVIEMTESCLFGDMLKSQFLRLHYFLLIQTTSTQRFNASFRTLLITIYHDSRTEARSNLPWISEFLKTGQTEQSSREVIGCWTIAGWFDGVTDWWTVWLEARGEARTSSLPRGREFTGLTIPDRRARRGTWDLRRNQTTSLLLTSLFHSLLLFRSPSPPRLPRILVKGSFMDLREQGAVKVQHLQKREERNSFYNQNHSWIIWHTKGAVIYLQWQWRGNTSAAYITTQVHTGKNNSERWTWFSRSVCSSSRRSLRPRDFKT